MLQFFLSTWRSGFRNRVFYSVFALGLALVAVAYLSASFSPRQPRTVALDVGLSGLRFSLVLFAIIVVQDLVGREIERRAVVLSLSYPISRSQYLFGRYLGVLALSGVAAAILSITLWLAVLISTGYDQQFATGMGLAYWGSVLAVWVDVAVVASFTLCIASLSTVPMLPLIAGGGFAVLARALGPMADYLAFGADGQIDLATTYGPLLGAIRWSLPDLSRLDWRVWPMYGLEPDLLTAFFSVISAVAYSVAMLGLASHVFSRREFS